ncbi:MAG: hypothetical protein F6K37_01470 [Moorea sp. SIO4E2]|uniref:hypothetical protein n=1 Tax=Moorena sp. SIO4E2 TaxID=2607826 RepID=UPI0013B8ACC1|nr:hypothetical protein [Moorena sp. SIO4E2]NEQ04708.1 hypothetical protein [Moorena sp. SIO4E2]
MAMIQIDIDDIYEAKHLSLELYADSSDELFDEIESCNGDLESGLSHLDDVDCDEPDSIFYNFKEIFCNYKLIKEIQQYNTVEALAAFILSYLASNPMFRFAAKNVKQGLALLLAIYIIKEGIDQICNN